MLLIGCGVAPPGLLTRTVAERQKITASGPRALTFIGQSHIAACFQARRALDGETRCARSYRNSRTQWNAPIDAAYESSSTLGHVCFALYTVLRRSQPSPSRVFHLPAQPVDISCTKRIQALPGPEVVEEGKEREEARHDDDNNHP